MKSYQPSNERRLLRQIVCPHCWTSFPPEETLAIAESPDLLGDRKLGPNDYLRFLPTEFDEKGFPIDPKGVACKDYACPHCHLRLPMGALEAPALFMSIVGGPQTGKSYYLSSSTYTLRTVLPRDFAINFTDADPEMNRRVREYEDRQFASEDRIVKLDKTEESGDLYNAVTIGGQTFVYPQPFVFTAHPLSEHPNASRAETAARTICLYDNSGESYLATNGADSADKPFTRHLARSKCIFFLYDPTQDARFKAECRQCSEDAQLREDKLEGYSEDASRAPKRQEAVLNEMVKRVRTYLRLKNTERYRNPLVVIVAKYDVWKPLFQCPEGKLISRGVYNGREYYALNKERVLKLSDAVRAFLMSKTPDFVAVAEAFASEVVYLPVSATGRSPIVEDSSIEPGKIKIAGFRSTDLAPIWCEIPMLYALARTAPGLVPFLAGKEIDG